MTLSRPILKLGPIIEDTIVPPGEIWTGIVEAGNYLRLVDVEGRQAIDFLCYNADDPSERYAAADTIKMAGTIYLGQWNKLYSDMARPIFTIVADSCGFHDTIGGACSKELNEVRYGHKHTPNCRDNFLRGLARFGLGKKDIVTNVNFFMYVPVEPDGGMRIASRSEPGDFVDLRAEMKAMVALSNCPQTYNAANNYNPSQIRVVMSKPA